MPCCTSASTPAQACRPPRLTLVALHQVSGLHHRRQQVHKHLQRGTAQSSDPHGRRASIAEAAASLTPGVGRQAQTSGAAAPCRTLHCTGVMFSAEQMTWGLTKPAAAQDQLRSRFPTLRSAGGGGERRRPLVCLAGRQPAARPLAGNHHAAIVRLWPSLRSRAPVALTPALLVEGGQLQQLLQQRPQLGQVIQRREPRKQRRAAPLNNFGASDEPHGYVSRPHRLPTPVHEAPIRWWPPMAGLCLRKHDGWLHALQRALIGHRLPLLRSNWSISSEVPPTARRGWLLRELALRSCLSQRRCPLGLFLKWHCGDQIDFDSSRQESGCGCCLPPPPRLPQTAGRPLPVHGRFQQLRILMQPDHRGCCRAGGMARPKAVVTGGAGYVGQRLGRALAGAGFDVLLLDLAPPPGLADAPLPSLCFEAVDVRDEAGGQGCWHLINHARAACRAERLHLPITASKRQTGLRCTSRLRSPDCTLPGRLSGVPPRIIRHVWWCAAAAAAGASSECGGHTRGAGGGSGGRCGPPRLPQHLVRRLCSTRVSALLRRPRGQFGSQQWARSKADGASWVVC